MKRDQRKLTRSAELLGAECDLTDKMHEFDRFDAKCKQEGAVLEKRYLLEISNWEVISEPLKLCIRELVSKQQEIDKKINEEEEYIRNILREYNGKINTPINSLDTLREMVNREEQELREEEEKLRLKKIEYDNEATKLSSKSLVYKCILPIEASLQSTAPISIHTTLKKHNCTAVETFTFSEADLNSSEITNKLWDY